MHQRPKRRFFTPAESAEIWDRWQRGEGLKSIGRVFGKTSSVIFAHLSAPSGIDLLVDNGGGWRSDDRPLSTLHIEPAPKQTVRTAGADIPGVYFRTVSNLAVAPPSC